MPAAARTSLSGPTDIAEEPKFIRVDLGDDNHDHLIDPEIKAQLALTRQ